jgi:hypothetical protein
MNKLSICTRTGIAYAAGLSEIPVHLDTELGKPSHEQLCLFKNAAVTKSLPVTIKEFLMPPKFIQICRY